VLAVVKDQEQALGRQEVSQRAHQPTLRRIAEPQGAGNRLSKEGRITEIGELRHPDPVGEGPPETGRRPKGEATLPDARGPDEREEGRGRQGLPDLAKLPPPSHEGGELAGEVLSPR
jgi:hypothetical protein